jgi:hypothetical protein
MQIAEIQLHTGTGGSGSAIFAPGNAALCTGWNSSNASGQVASRVIDNNSTTNSLNFGENNSGFYVVPSVGATIMTSFQLTTAGDVEARDPASWQLHGMAPNGQWALIGSGTVSLPSARGRVGPVVSVSNTTAYLAYRMTFPTVKDPTTTNSMQVAEAQFFGTILPANDSDFADWMTANYPSILFPDNQPGADPENDGIANLLEYVLQGGDPSVSTTGTLPTLDASGADFVFTYYRRAAATGTTQTFEYGTTLNGWTPVAIPGGAGVVVTPDTPGTGIDEVKITVAKGAETKLFGRLQVVK